MEINDKTLAQDCVERFVRRFDASYRLLACFAALPLVLTPELLNYLRNRFLRGEVPWVAEVDLLLSELCSEVGYEQYIMSLPIRNYLLSEMRAQFGAQRQQEVALVLLDYVKHLARTKTAGSRPELEVQQWSAMLYIENQRADAVGRIAAAFRDLVSPAAAEADAPPALDQTALARLVRITQELAPQLQDFPELVRYSKELSRLLAHPATVDKTPGGVEQSQGVVQLMGVELPSVAQVSQRMSAPLQKPATAEMRQARDRTSTKAAARPPTRPYEYDIFVSYAHADDEIPPGARNGWVTTLVEELRKVLRRMLGGSGARIWMDHQLTANVNVLDTLLAPLRDSRILLLVMSPSYHQSEWCQRELGNFLAQSAAEKHKDNVFIIEFEPVPRETWPSALQALMTMRFWEKGFTDQAPRPLGFPVPKLDEDNPYWRNVNELAHLIAESLRQHADRPPESRAAILLAETTEDLLDHRDAVAVFLRQHGVDVLPSVVYPRDSRAAFVSAVQRDLARSLAFVQLLGPYEGRRPPDDPTTFVVLQADQALLLQQQRAVPILQWRTPEVEPDTDREPYLPRTRREAHGPDRGARAVQARDSEGLATPAHALVGPALAGTRTDSTSVWHDR